MFTFKKGEPDCSVMIGEYQKHHMCAAMSKKCKDFTQTGPRYLHKYSLLF